MTGDDPEYQYHLKDHLGNVRVTFTTKQDIEENTATLETANDATEESQFLYYDEAVKINSTLFDHTNAGATQYATRLSGSPNELTGLAKSISVMPGDTIRTEVYAKYLDGNTSNWTTALTNFMAAIAGGTAPEGTFVDGGATGSTGGTTPSFIGLLDKGDETGNAPKAYLNYLIFDKNYVLLNGGFVRMSENAREYGQDGAHEKLAAEFVITEPGYVYIYLSNDNAALGGSTIEVYFDDFNVEHTKSPVIQSDSYYPFGARIDALSFKRESSLKNKYLFNGGSELQDDLGLDVYGTLYRTYDPWGRLGWWQIDPLVDEFTDESPYNFSHNNPVRNNDPNGDCPECLSDVGKGVWGAIAGAVTSTIDLVKDTYSTGGQNLVDGAKAVGSFVQGAVNDPSGAAEAIVGAAKEGFIQKTVEAGSTQAAASQMVGEIALGAVGTKGAGALLKTADKTENVVRVMSKAELNATKNTGLVRGGREGTHYATDAVSDDAKRSRQRLALPQTPEVKATLSVKKGTFSSPTKVQPANNMPGGGLERTATGNVPVTIKKVEVLKNTGS